MKIIKVTILFSVCKVFASQSRSDNVYSFATLREKIQAILDNRYKENYSSMHMNIEYLNINFTQKKEKIIWPLAGFLSKIFKYYENENKLNFYTYMQYNNSKFHMNYEDEYFFNFFYNAYSYRSNKNLLNIEAFDQLTKMHIEYNSDFNEFKAKDFIKKMNKGPHYMLIDNCSTDEKDYSIMLLLYQCLGSIEKRNRLQYNYFIVLNFEENSKNKHNIVAYIKDLYEQLPQNIDDITYTFCHLNYANFYKNIMKDDSYIIGLEHHFSCNNLQCRKRVNELTFHTPGFKPNFRNMISTLPYAHFSECIYETPRVISYLSKNFKVYLTIDYRFCKISFMFFVEKTKFKHIGKNISMQNRYSMLEIVSIYFEYNGRYRLHGRFCSFICDNFTNQLNNKYLYKQKKNMEMGQHVGRNFISYVKKLYFLSFSVYSFYLPRYTHVTNEFLHLSHFAYNNRAYFIQTNVISNFKSFNKIIKKLSLINESKIELYFFESKLIQNSCKNVETDNIRYFYNRLKIAKYIDNDKIVIESYNTWQAITIVIKTYKQEQIQYVYMSIPISSANEIIKMKLFQNTYLKAKFRRFGLDIQKNYCKYENVIDGILNILIINQPIYIIERFFKTCNLISITNNFNLDVFIIGYLISIKIIDETICEIFNNLLTLEEMQTNICISKLSKCNILTKIYNKHCDNQIFKTVQKNVLNALIYFENKLKEEYLKNFAKFNKTVCYISPGKSTYDNELLERINDVLTK